MGTVIIGVVVILVGGGILLMMSDVGKDPKTKTDQQLYRRYCASLKQTQIALRTDLEGWGKATQSVKAYGEEMERRGYDISKLFREEFEAKWENRPMDFSKCRKA